MSVDLNLGLTDLSGRPVRIAEYVHRGAIVYITASHVAIGADAPYLIEEYAGLVAGDLDVVVLLADDSVEASRRTIRRRGYELPALWLGGHDRLRASLASVLPGLPATLFIREDGTLCSVLVGSLTPHRLGFAIRALQLEQVSTQGLH